MTRAKDVKAVKRIIQAEYGEMVVEVRARTVTLRPLGTRKGGPAEVSMLWGQVYVREMMRRTSEQLEAKRRAGKGRRR